MSVDDLHEAPHRLAAEAPSPPEVAGCCRAALRRYCPGLLMRGFTYSTTCAGKSMGTGLRSPLGLNGTLGMGGDCSCIARLDKGNGIAGIREDWFAAVRAATDQDVK